MGIAARVGLLPDFQERKARRRPVRIDARIRELGSEGVDAQVYNLSITGFLAEADNIFPVGAYIWLKLPGANGLNARIVWRDSFRYGCEFIVPIDTELCDSFAEASRVAAA